MRAWRVALGALALGVSTAAIAAPAERADPTFTGRDLFDLSVATDPQISPDGRRIAYVRRTADIMTDRMVPSIWLVDVATGEQRPIATTGSANMSPRWSPDGRRLAFVSTSDGGGMQLYVRWMDSGERVRITNLPDSPRGLAWSPDGRQIAYLMNVPDEGPTLGKAPPKPEGAEWAKPLEIIDKVTYRADGGGYLKPGFDHIFVVPATGGAARQVTFGAYHDEGPLNWTPDGRSIVFSANRSTDWERDARDSELYEVALDGGTLRALTTRDGPDALPRLSPDGRSIAYAGFDDDQRAFPQSNLYF